MTHGQLGKLVELQQQGWRSLHRVAADPTTDRKEMVFGGTILMTNDDGEVIRVKPDATVERATGWEPTA